MISSSYLVNSLFIYRKMGSRGQIVLPKDARDLLGWKVGDEIRLEVTKNFVKITRIFFPTEKKA
ncbi:MAG TPA: AbrB/MazE/SpoVT family DNA-binding domain-containing protein [Candidatus Lokiarchaeia archaeon]|nr:AbrB/MazE/SpoVT family DNA-binding domain-containing protein [Candidatus Lokiarchaeia archaeon]